MKKNVFIEFFWFFVKALILVVILIKFVFMPCVVNGTSMRPTYEEGDYGYSFILTKMLGISRFDTVVIRPDPEDSEKLLVKRVIGLPGDTVEYKDNVLYINGEACAEDFLGDVTTQDLQIKLGDNEYYCLGDNRNVSRDSRFYGPFRNDQIVSTHFFIIYPFTDIGFNK